MKRVIVAKLVLFTMIAIWDMIFLGLGILLCGRLSEFLTELEMVSWLVKVFIIWYLVTLVGIGTYSALKAFRVIGRWEAKGAAKPE